MGTLPISPATLPWWGWILCAAGCGLLARIGSQNKNGGAIAGALTAVGGIGAIICVFLGVYRYMRWF
ncbi:MAG: hypothetical protein ABSD20_20715 [Terriglobales bacterium]|jgi:hypothetical protein